MTIVERALELIEDGSTIGLGSGRAAQAFVRALGEFGSIVIVAGNIPMKTQVASVYVYGEIESYNPQAATSVSVLILLISFLVLLLLERLTRRPGERLPRLFQWTRQKDGHGSESAVPTAAV